MSSRTVFSEHEAVADGFESYYKILSFFNRLDRALRSEAAFVNSCQRPDLLAARSSVERAFRRHQLLHARSDEDVDQALWWFSENGSFEDLNLIRQVTLAEAQRGLAEMTKDVIQRRTEIAATNIFKWPWSLILLGILLTAAFIVISITGFHGAVSFSALVLLVALTGGLGTSAFLLCGALTKSTNLITSCCLATAGVLMASELAMLLHHVVLSIRK